MIEVWLTVPRGTDVAELKLPPSAHPHGAQPHWAPREFIAEFADQDAARDFLDYAGKIEGVYGIVRGAPNGRDN